VTYLSDHRNENKIVDILFKFYGNLIKTIFFQDSYLHFMYTRGQVKTIEIIVEFILFLLKNVFEFGNIWTWKTMESHGF
jgi:hypothetical protein